MMFLQDTTAQVPRVYLTTMTTDVHKVTTVSRAQVRLTGVKMDTTKMNYRSHHARYVLQVNKKHNDIGRRVNILFCLF